MLRGKDTVVKKEKESEKKRDNKNLNISPIEQHPENIKPVEKK